MVRPQKGVLIMKTKPKHAAVLKDGEKVYVGNAGKDEVEYGLVLEALEDGGFGCDLFFRDSEFTEHDALGFVWLEDSCVSAAQLATAQAAVDYAMGTLQGMLQRLADAGTLCIQGGNGHSMMIEA